MDVGGNLQTNQLEDQVRLRRNIFSFSREQFIRLLFWFSLFTYLARIIAISVILVLSRADSVIQPFRYFLSLYLVQMTLSFSVTIFHRIYAPIDPDIDPIGYSSQSMMQKCICQVGKILDFTFFFFIIFGSVLITSGSSRADYQQCPMLFWMTAALVIYDVMILFLPVLIMLSFCLCLPCAIIFFSWWSPRSRQAALNQMLSKLYVCKYRVNESHRIYGKEIIIKPEDTTCPICLQVYKSGIDLRILPCGHYYHNRCVDEWLRIATNCPLCKAPISLNHDDNVTP